MLDSSGRPVGRAHGELRQHFPRPGWVEHDPDEIWALATRVAGEALADAGASAADVRGIGVANQRETAVAWDRRSGRALGPAIVWQDRRTAGRCRELRHEGHEELIASRTGLRLDPYFSATKFAWLLAHYDRPRQVALGTIDAWLLFKLCGRHATEVGNASRTMLLDIRSAAWDGELCDLLGVPIAALPEVVSSAGPHGDTAELGARVPVTAVLGDQQAALYGQACRGPGRVKSTYGTGSFVLQAGADPDGPGAEQGLLTSIAWRVDDRLDHALEASILVSGAAVQWLRDGLGLLAEAAETEALARSLSGNDGVWFVPALAGLGSPYWDPHARGTILGLTRGSGRAHLARAALEAIAYQTVDAVRAQEEALGTPLEELRADGGATANGWLMQFQADVLGAPVVVPDVAETTALGAGFLAGSAAGLWSEAETAAMWRKGSRFEPRMSVDERESLLAGWHRALERARDWAEDDEPEGLAG